MVPSESTIQVPGPEPLPSAEERLRAAGAELLLATALLMSKLDSDTNYHAAGTKDARVLKALDTMREALSR